MVLVRSPPRVLHSRRGKAACKVRAVLPKRKQHHDTHEQRGETKFMSAVLGRESHVIGKVQITEEAA